MKLTKFSKKIIAFIFVGTLNTIIDFAFYNLIFTLFKTGPVIANIFSTSIAITASYFLNKKLVFSHHGKLDIKSVATFVIFTLFGLWVIQGLIISASISFFTANYHTGYLSNSTTINNISKVLATAVSTVWNFTIYDRIVFKKSGRFN